MRQVIFIAGTAYSGSTMLDMILGSSDSSFSMGEVRALFHPSKKYHINPPCGCGSETCNIWESIKESGEKNLYLNIFDRFPETKTIIDSSKEPFWIARQKNRLKKIGVNTTVILVWKKPQEFASSRMKRGQLKGWKHAWVNYHRLFLSLNKADEWRSVKYKELAVSPDKTIQSLCKNVGVEYIPEMLQFWQKKHHILFGNTLAKYHMYEKNNIKFHKSILNLKEREINFDNEKEKLERRHRSIYYVDDFIGQLPLSVNSDIENSQFMNLLKTIISANNIDKNTNPTIEKTDQKGVIYSKILLNLLRTNRFIKYKFRSIKYPLKVSNVGF